MRNPIVNVADEHCQYLLLQIGWSGLRRIHGVTVHVRVKNDKIHVEQDWTEEGIATDLIHMGVSRDDIILTFHEPEVRHTGDLVMR